MTGLDWTLGDWDTLPPEQKNAIITHYLDPANEADRLPPHRMWGSLNVDERGRLIDRIDPPAAVVRHGFACASPFC